MIGKKTDRLVKFQVASSTYRAQLFRFKVSPCSRPKQTPVLHIFTQRHFVGHKYKLSHQGGSRFQCTGQISALLHQSVDCSLNLLSCQDSERRKDLSIKPQTETRYMCPVSNSHTHRENKTPVKV